MNKRNRTCGWCDSPATDVVAYARGAQGRRSHVCAAHISSDLAEIEAISVPSREVRLLPEHCSGAVLDALAVTR